jgi:predicted DsbA family dithiol-disulfide isomerase
VRIDVWSDVVCPWCAVGIGNLDAALDGFAHAEEVEVVLHAFQLDPGAPRRDDTDLTTRLAQKYGISVGQARAGQARLVNAGAELGIDFRFDRAVTGNTFDAHRLLALARRRDLQLPLEHRLWRAYFTDGEPIGEHDTLRRSAVDVGLDPDEVDALLAGDAFADDVRADLARARELGIGGVPFFVVDDEFGLSGAQPPELLRKVLERRWAERAPSPLTMVDGADPDAACGPDGCEL